MQIYSFENQMLCAVIITDKGRDSISKSFVLLWSQMGWYNLPKSKYWHGTCSCGNGINIQWNNTKMKTTILNMKVCKSHQFEYDASILYNSLVDSLELYILKAHIYGHGAVRAKFRYIPGGSR